MKILLNQNKWTQLLKLENIINYKNNRHFTWYKLSSPGGSRHSNSQHRSPTRKFLQNYNDKTIERENESKMEKHMQIYFV